MQGSMKSRRVLRPFSQHVEYLRTKIKERTKIYRIITFRRGTQRPAPPPPVCREILIRARNRIRHRASLLACSQSASSFRDCTKSLFNVSFLDVGEKKEREKKAQSRSARRLCVRASMYICTRMTRRSSRILSPRCEPCIFKNVNRDRRMWPSLPPTALPPHRPIYARLRGRLP